MAWLEAFVGGVHIDQRRGFSPKRRLHYTDKLCAPCRDGSILVLVESVVLLMLHAGSAPGQ